MIEMAPETAKRCEERREGRGGSPDRAARQSRSQPFRRPQDMVHLPGYVVEKDLKMNDISCAFSPRIQTDGLIPFRPD